MTLIINGEVEHWKESCSYDFQYSNIPILQYSVQNRLQRFLTTRVYLGMSSKTSAAAPSAPAFSLSCAWTISVRSAMAGQQ